MSAGMTRMTSGVTAVGTGIGEAVGEATVVVVDVGVGVARLGMTQPTRRRRSRVEMR